jgi:zinc transport system substrate-binding protein
VKLHSLIATVLILVAMLLAGCRRGDETARRPVVVVSVLPQAYFVERLAGERVQVEVMIPPGASPATYEPSMRQMQAVARASLYVKVGHPSFPFERAWLDRLLAGNEKVTLVDSSAGVPQLEGDPHVWLSPEAVRAMVRNIAAALLDDLPEHRREIEQRREALLRDIDVVDVEIRAALSSLKHRWFFVFHPAWGYFAREYDLEQVAIEQKGREPDARTLSALVARARAEGVRVIFAQPQFSTQSAEMVARAIGGRVVVIDPLARDWVVNMRRVAAAFREALGS